MHSKSIQFEERDNYLQVDQGAKHRFSEPLLLGHALIENGWIFLAVTPEGIPVPPVYCTCGGIHIIWDRAQISCKVAAPIFHDSHTILEVGKVDAVFEKRRFCCNIPAKKPKSFQHSWALCTGSFPDLYGNCSSVYYYYQMTNAGSCS